MGLDMYLKARRYVEKYADYRTKALAPAYTSLATLYPELDNDDIYGFEVSRVVAYWRKANQVHNWFVEECQRGVDDCRETYVSRGKLQELLNLCRRVALERDAELLPPRAGFFFGGTGVDEWYWEDIEETIQQLSQVLDDPRLEGYEFFYQSSW